MPRTRTLIVTLPPMRIGGVTSKVRILADALRQAGQDVTVAYYALPGGTDDPVAAFGPVESVAVACRRPWLEQDYTSPSPAWDRLIAEHDRHVAVGGTVLIANPLAAAGTRHMVWCAADLAGDRAFRQAAMPAWRRLGDRLLVLPALRRQQAAVLGADNRIFGVSHDTVARLRALAPDRGDDIQRLPIPVDTAFFTPEPPGPAGLVLGFAGRLDDPRKNAPLLFATLAVLRARGHDAKLHVTGNETDALRHMAALAGVGGQITYAGLLERDGLRGFYRSLDVFVIPSLQEGLAIAGLEAMACGVPVVSTRCGGPEDYVIDGESGALSAMDADAMADAVLRTAAADRAKASAAARAVAERDYAMDQFLTNLAECWRTTWGENP